MRPSAPSVVRVALHEYCEMKLIDVPMTVRRRFGLAPVLIEVALPHHTVGVPNVPPNSVEEIYILSSRNRVVYTIPFNPMIDVNTRIVSVPRVVALVSRSAARIVPPAERVFDYEGTSIRAQAFTAVPPSSLEAHAMAYVEAIRRRDASAAGSPIPSQ